LSVAAWQEAYGMYSLGLQMRG